MYPESVYCVHHLICVYMRMVYSCTLNLCIIYTISYVYMCAWSTHAPWICVLFTWSHTCICAHDLLMYLESVYYLHHLICVHVRMVYSCTLKLARLSTLESRIGAAFCYREPSWEQARPPHTRRAYNIAYRSEFAQESLFCPCKKKKKIQRYPHD